MAFRDSDVSSMLRDSASDLSSLREDDESMSGGDDDAGSKIYEDAEPPTKRQKISGLDVGGVASRAYLSAAHTMAPEPPEPLREMEGNEDDHDDHDDPLEGVSVSSDSDGDIPGSPTAAGVGTGAGSGRPDDDEWQEQMTKCSWEGCRAGDLGNMDRLVEHIHNEHIEGRQKKYTCEWVNCSRKGMTHASGYALKAHMRSHTREKPFYCYLPECDRAFTRSDALAKHMRTVHETEALRPSDPVPKSMMKDQAGAGGGRASKPLKIILKTQQSHATGQDDSVDEGSVADDSSAAGGGGGGGDDTLTPLTQDQGFTAEELSLPVKKLAQLCRLQARWAEQQGEALRRECAQWEALYKREWLDKEVLLDQVVQSEQDWRYRRRAVLASSMPISVVAGTNGRIKQETGNG